MKSIQNKILAVVIAGLIVITAVVSTIAVNMTHEVMHKDADRILKNATEKEGARINDVFGDVEKSCNIMEHIAASEIENASAFKDPDFCKEYIAKIAPIFEEVAANTTSIAGFFLRINPEYSNNTSGFYKTVNDNGVTKDMPITDLGKYEKDDKQNVGWYYEAINAGKGVWLEPYFFPGLERQLISYVQPIYVDNELIAVIGFDMDFDYLAKRVDEIKVYEYGHAELLASDGISSYYEIAEVETHNPHTQAKVELKNGMHLVMHADYKDIQHDIHPMLRKIVFSFVIVFVCALVYTFAVTTKIVRPLKRLTAEAEKLSNGVADAKIDVVYTETNDEIGVLARVLYQTYSKIQEYTSYINALAYRDALTGIKNHTAYVEATGKLNQEIRTGNPSFGVLVADINNLKETNDKYGHDVGNDLIVHTAKILAGTFRSSAVYRIGGDEFVVLLQGNDYAQYYALIEKMDKECASDNISVGEQKIPVSVARGISLFDTSIDHVYEDVFAKADQAMYMNKQQMKQNM